MLRKRYESLLVWVENVGRSREICLADAWADVWVDVLIILPMLYSEVRV